MPKEVGRPLKFESVEQLQERIDDYFRVCEEKQKPLTITGLALHLDTNRQTIINYEAKDEYFDTIKRAKLMCENFAEEYLFTGKNIAGAIFNLKNNYRWKEEMAIDHTSKGEKINMQSLSDAELRNIASGSESGTR